ncbi:MFS transporter [Chondrinema litorale]|uniref:MFS transporter n=1 Tax=Chondrinema litorale TaxID=2994555 RepID=UPI0025439E77|nr:MFS transporter [Chondrinema litorale]UZR96655.1 MFS transporter [Chondrinema litorale]
MNNLLTLKKSDTIVLSSSFMLGLAQILLWGGSFFILTILAEPIMKDTGWSQQYVYGSFSLALMVSGLLSPKIGKFIHSLDKNIMLLYAGVVMGVGLITIGLAQNIYFFILGWAIIGIAMSMGLHDALFASLGKKYGMQASQFIIQITLISGFVTTIIWPILTYLVSTYGWRITCFIYAIALIVFIVPIHYLTIYTNGRTESIKNDLNKLEGESISVTSNKSVYYLLLINFTIGSILMTGLYVHLIDILTNKNISLKEAIGISALLGPCQVGVRVLDIIFSKKTPIVTAVISSILVFSGLLILLFSPEISFLGIAFFGFGNGMRSILRGTLPLWIYGSDSYASIMGQLARFPLIAQALTPFIGGLIIQYFDITYFLEFLCGLAVLNILIMFILKKQVFQVRNT